MEAEGTAAVSGGMSGPSLVQSLVTSLVAVVTLHYITSPFIIKPHPQVTQNM